MLTWDGEVYLFIRKTIFSHIMKIFISDYNELPLTTKLHELNGSPDLVLFLHLENTKYSVLGSFNFGNSHVFNLCSPRILNNTSTPNFTNEALENLLTIFIRKIR